MRQTKTTAQLDLLRRNDTFAPSRRQWGLNMRLPGRWRGNERPDPDAQIGPADWARERLPADDYERAVARGRQLTVDEAIAMALDE